MRLLLLAGSGGAGTTTVAAATAVRAARRGLKTLLLTPEPGVASRPASDSDQPTDRPAAGAECEAEPGLVLRTLDARARGERAWAALGASATALLTALGVDPVQAEELTGLPGLDDVLTLLEIRDAAAAGWDLVVVDAPALARTVRLLALPEAVDRAVDRVLPLERRMLWAMGHGATSGCADGLPRGVVAGRRAGAGGDRRGPRGADESRHHGAPRAATPAGRPRRRAVGVDRARAARADRRRRRRQPARAGRR